MSTGFLPSVHGFPFANCWPDGTPVFEVPTPFGRIPVGNARLGLCGGMVFTALDLFHAMRAVPACPNPTAYRYIARRQVESLRLPFGAMRFYAWQTRPELGQRTAAIEWPRVKATLDSGQPATLGLVKVYSRDPRETVKNHQVLAYGYAVEGDVLTLHTYDPNYPGDDVLSLTLDLAAPTDGVWHSREGPTVRGFFRTGYATPRKIPDLE
jgi:hypothetical protein